MCSFLTSCCDDTVESECHKSRVRAPGVRGWAWTLSPLPLCADSSSKRRSRLGEGLQFNQGYSMQPTTTKKSAHHINIEEMAQLLNDLAYTACLPACLGLIPQYAHEARCTKRMKGPGRKTTYVLVLHCPEHL